MNRKYLYIEAGLAVLLIFTLGIAGAKGVLSSLAAGSDVDENCFQRIKRKIF